MIFVYPLTKEEREELQRVMESTSSAKWHQRLAIIELSAQGYEASTLARMFHMHGNTVRNYINSYNAGGINALIPKAIGPKSIIYDWRVKELSGKEIRENRQKYGLNQEILAALLKNVTCSTIDSWEKGKTKPNKVALIAMQLLFDKMKKGYRPFIDVREISGKEIRRKREKCGLTREMMAALVGVTLPTIYKWERGVAKPSKISFIAMQILFEKLKKPNRPFIKIKISPKEIKKYCEKFGLSSSALAEMLNIDPSTVNCWKRGTKTSSGIAGIAVSLLIDKMKDGYKPSAKLYKITKEEIKKNRLRFDLSQETLARLLSASRIAVQKWEDGDQIPRGISATALRLLFERLERDYQSFIQIKEMTGEEIRTIRERFGLSQEVVSALLDVTLSIFSGWERGSKPRRTSMLAIRFLFEKLEKEYRPFVEGVYRVSGAEIKEKREKFGLSQEVMAALLSVSPSIVNKWEKGVRQPKYMSALALKLLFEKLEEGYSPFRIR